MVLHHAAMAKVARPEESNYQDPRIRPRSRQQESLPPEDHGPTRRVLLATSMGLALGMLAQPELLFRRKEEGSEGITLPPAGRRPVAPEPPLGAVRERLTNPIEISAGRTPQGWTSQGGNLWEVENNWLRPLASGLLASSRAMTDGSMAYMLQIVRGGANFLMRAQDMGNHYAVRLRNGDGGPDPMRLQAVVVRGGAERVIAEERIAETVTWFRSIHHLDVKMDRDFFTAQLNGTIVGTWRDRTFGQGAIGVEVAETDQFRLYQGRVTPA
jgi:hypothetical protein